MLTALFSYLDSSRVNKMVVGKQGNRIRSLVHDRGLPSMGRHAALATLLGSAVAFNVTEMVSPGFEGPSVKR